MDLTISGNIRPMVAWQYINNTREGWQGDDITYFRRSNGSENERGHS